MVHRLGWNLTRLMALRTSLIHACRTSRCVAGLFANVSKVMLIDKAESESSLRTSHDQLSALQKQNSELARKLREAEQKLSDLG